MFSRKKKAPPARKKERTSSSVPFDLGIPGFQSNQEENDSDLEAELFALTGETSNSDFTIQGDVEDDDLEAELARIIGSEKKNANTKVINEVKNVISTENIDEGDEDSDDLDEDDPELLNELKVLTDVVSDEEIDNSENVGSVEEVKVTVSQLDLIAKRLMVYQEAENAAKAKKDLARARRYNRGIKTLEQLHKKAKTGVFIPYNEIPPEIATNLKPDTPIVAPTPTSFIDSSIMEEKEGTNIMKLGTDQAKEKIPLDTCTETAAVNDISNLEISDIPTKNSQETIENMRDTRTSIENLDENASNSVLTLLILRKEEFRKLALAAKKSGDIQAALGHMREVKTCEKLITMHNSGNVISESDIPQLPTGKKSVKIDNPPLKSPSSSTSTSSGLTFTPVEIFTTPKTVSEALNQRLNYYLKAMQKAESMGKRNDLRKLENIVKIYQNSIKLHSKGGAVPFQKLPTPPGCPPIPMTFQMA